MAPENGSTEIWLGTHSDSGLHVQEGLHGERASGRIKKHLLEKRKAERPPCQPVVKKGSIIVRDLRLWHAGRGNLSSEPRVMLAMSTCLSLSLVLANTDIDASSVHFAPWYRNQMRLEFATDLRDEIEGQDSLEVPVDWVDDSQAMEGYLNRGFGNSYDFSQAA